jgi:ribonuclease R
VVEILERCTTSLVGRLYREQGITFVTPENKRIAHRVLIPPKAHKKAKEGEIVVVEITEQPSKRNQPVGKVVEVLGAHMAPGMEIEVAIRSYDLPAEWPSAVDAEANKISSTIPSAALKGRVDLRDLPLVTIDGADARDFDDAVYCEPKPKGWRVIVAIADVAHYVRPRKALDVEAYNRGNSVYFPSQVIPMLPEVLSNGLCSLNPNVDRLSMACDMYINHAGKITRSSFCNAVIRSHARLTYDQAAEIIVERKHSTRALFSEVAPHLDNLYGVYKALLKARNERGTIDFETTETRIVFGEDRKIDAVVPVVRNDAHKLIEECMIAANVCAARYLERNDMPALYRVHDGPGEEKLAELHEFLGGLALRLGGGAKPQPVDYARLLNQVRDRPDAHMIQTVLLRSLSQAVYTPDNQGHFGLAHEAYAHFTSPIRRYPDLLVHRAIRHVLSGKNPSLFAYSEQAMVTHGEHCSTTERRADEATRDVMDWLKCEFMMDHIGDDFSGTITGVSSFGLFVELDDVYVTGLVHVTSLGRDYFYHDPAGHRMTGERSGKVYRLGDRIGIKVVRVNLDDRKIDLEPLEKVGGDAPARKPKSKTRKSKSRSKTGPKSKVDTKPDTQSSDKPKKRRRRRRG